MKIAAIYEPCRRTLIALSSLLLLTLFFPQANADEQPYLAEVPFNLIDNRVQLTLNVGENELRFLMDTGASRTVLFQSADHDFTEFSQAGETTVLFPALDEVVTGVILEPIAISFGEHAFVPLQPLLILQRSPVGDRLSIKFNGILGQDFFRTYVVEVNPKKRVLRIYNNGTTLKKSFRTRLHLHMKGSAPHIRFTSKFPWEHREKVKELLIDTGYPGSMVIWNERHFRQAAGTGNADDMKANNTGIFTRATFEIANLRFMQAPIFIAANEPVQANERDGLLGSNVLNQFHHIIDFQERKLLLSVVGIHKLGVDGGFYLPNNEDYIIRRFHRPQSSPVFIIE